MKPPSPLELALHHLRIASDLERERRKAAFWDMAAAIFLGLVAVAATGFLCVVL